MSQPATIIHEYNEKGQHRLVLVSPDSTNIASPWTEIHALVKLDKFIAHAGSVDDVLPPGVFTVREINHQVLA